MILECIWTYLKWQVVRFSLYFDLKHFKNDQQFKALNNTKVTFYVNLMENEIVCNITCSY